MNIFESLVVLRWLNTVLAVCENISFTNHSGRKVSAYKLKLGKCKIY